jgi:chemotaxis protein MotB
MALSRRTGARFQGSIWPGFVDAMTGLLLVLMFVLTIFMIVQFVLRETISGQETKLDSMGVEIAALAAALGLEQQSNADLETRVGTLNATLGDARSQMNEQRALISSLTADRDAKIVDLERARGQISGFEAQVAMLLASKADAEARISGLVTERADNESRIADLEAARATLVDEQSAMTLALASARSEIDAQVETARLAAAKREALEALIADLGARNAQSEAAVIELRDQLSQEETAKLAEAAAAAELRARLENADAELTAMTLSLEMQRQDAEDTLTLLAAARAAEETLIDDLAAALAQQLAAQSDLEKTDAELLATRSQLADAETAMATTEDAEKRLRRQLTDALTAQVLAQQQAGDLNDLAAQALADRDAALTDANRRALLLAEAENALKGQEEISTRAQRNAELLNQQVAALREQLGGLQSILDDAKDRDAAAQIQLQSLGSDLNAALARAAAEERRARLLEEAERRRLEKIAADAAAAAEGLTEETRRLADQAEELARYKSEFFGRLRDLLADQEGVHVAGDRFVFSSEVLFDAGSAELSPEGQIEISKIAQILRNISGDIPDTIDWVIRVDGHTDNVPISQGGQYDDNWELSQARALSVVRYMVRDLGISPNRLAANGFGEYQPLDIADTAAARAKNRRIELKLTER